MTTDASSSVLDQLKNSLEKLDKLEDELSASSFALRREENNASPTAVVSDELIQRYQSARSLYLQSRMQRLLLDHISTFDGDTFTFPTIDDDDDDDDDVDIDEDGNKTSPTLRKQHAEALMKLERSAQNAHAQFSNLQDSYQAMRSQREELKCMIEDLEQDTSMEIVEDDLENSDDPLVSEEDLAKEQERIEQLQKTKRELQEELARVKEETQQLDDNLKCTKEELSLLEKQHEDDDNESQSNSSLEEKITELEEIKIWYDGMREVMEELGGVKIMEVTERHSHLYLTVLLYETHQVEIQLEKYRKIALKVVDANWITEPVVYGEAATEEEEVFSLSLASLSDLVQVAKTTFGPVQDLRFIIREAMARIRTMQNRVTELDLLRRHVLTNVVASDQVVCSLNEGLVIVFRLYEHVVVLEKIVGVGGWDQSMVDQIKTKVSCNTDENWSPKEIVIKIQEQVDVMKRQGNNPATPRLPKKKGGKQLH